MPDKPPNKIFEELHDQASTLVGARLFTIMLIDNDGKRVNRAYTSHPVDYPVSGSKPVNRNRWYQQVIVKKRSFVANSTAEFSDVFPDHEIINSLGCESALNVPIFANDQVAGTANFLDRPGHFTPERVEQLEGLVATLNAELLHALRDQSLAQQ